MVTASAAPSSSHKIVFEILWSAAMPAISVSSSDDMVLAPLIVRVEYAGFSRLENV
jgi:hypothetical protein